MIGGAMLLLPSTRAIFLAKGTNQDILFEMVSATRTDKIGKELEAVVRDLAEYRFAINWQPFSPGPAKCRQKYHHQNPGP